MSPSADEIVAALGQALIVTDLHGVVTTWNPAAERLYGWSQAEAIGRSIASLTVPEMSQDEADGIMDALRRGEAWSGTFMVRRRDGEAFRALVTNAPILDQHDAVQALVGLSTALGGMARPLLELSNDPALILDRAGLIGYVSQALTNVFGWSGADLIGQPLASLIHPDDGPLLERILRQTNPEASTGPVQLHFRAQDGSWRWTEATISNLTTDPGLRGVILVVRDVTDRRGASERLTRLVLHDPLTGLPNRSLLTERIQHGHSRRGEAGALLVIALDEFRGINREYGHAAGDRLIRALAARLNGALAVQDTCARLGGDEFAVLAESVRTPAEAIGLAEQLQLALGRPSPVDGTTVRLSSSIGVTLLAGRRRSHELLRECVAGVYDARQRGPGRVALFDSIGTASLPAGGVVKRLRVGLQAGEVQVHYQPVLDLVTRHLVGVEALLRWQHDGSTVLSADSFIEAAETDDLIHDLGRFVLGQACQQVAGSNTDLSLSVNVSARQLSDNTLADVVGQCLADSGLEPSRLTLEITETALMQDFGTALGVLAACRELGVGVSLDDFGTGFAGFGYLRELPVDEIKIDRSFVHGLSRQGPGAAIINGIVQMAHGLGLTTTGEGVETTEQARILTEIGCDRAQGYLWSAAVPWSGLPSALAGPLPSR